MAGGITWQDKGVGAFLVILYRLVYIEGRIKGNKSQHGRRASEKYLVNNNNNAIGEKFSRAKCAPQKAAQTSRKRSAAHAIGPGKQPSTPVPATTMQFRNHINYDD